jgi:hypothetical protein
MLKYPTLGATTSRYSLSNRRSYSYSTLNMVKRKEPCWGISTLACQHRRWIRPNPVVESGQGDAESVGPIRLFGAPHF